MKLQREVRHKSEDVDDTVLLDVVRAMRRRVKIVSRAVRHSLYRRLQYRRPDGLYRSPFRWLMKTVRVDPFLLLHEIVEKALLDELRSHYLHAHQIAVRAERDAVKAAGIPWFVYQRFMKRYQRPIELEKVTRVPRNLDLTPYRDQKDFSLLRRLVRQEKQKSDPAARRQNHT